MSRVKLSLVTGIRTLGLAGVDLDYDEEIVEVATQGDPLLLNLNRWCRNVVGRPRAVRRGRVRKTNGVRETYETTIYALVVAAEVLP